MSRQTYETLEAVAADPDLSDDDIVRSDGDPNFRVTVGDARAAVKYYDDRARVASYPAPDPFKEGIASMRAASATPASTFEDAWKLTRLEALAAEHARIARHIAEHPTLRAAEGKQYPAPDGYAIALAKENG